MIIDKPIFWTDVVDKYLTAMVKAMADVYVETIIETKTSILNDNAYKWELTFTSPEALVTFNNIVYQAFKNNLPRAIADNCWIQTIAQRETAMTLCFTLIQSEKEAETAYLNAASPSMRVIPSDRFMPPNNEVSWKGADIKFNIYSTEAIATTTIDQVVFAGSGANATAATIVADKEWDSNTRTATYVIHIPENPSETRARFACHIRGVGQEIRFFVEQGSKSGNSRYTVKP